MPGTFRKTDWTVGTPKGRQWIRHANITQEIRTSDVFTTLSCEPVSSFHPTTASLAQEGPHRPVKLKLSQAYRLFDFSFWSNFFILFPFFFLADQRFWGIQVIENILKTFFWCVQTITLSDSFNSTNNQNWGLLFVWSPDAWGFQSSWGLQQSPDGQTLYSWHRSGPKRF